MIPVFPDHRPDHPDNPDFVVVENDRLHRGIGWLQSDVVLRFSLIGVVNEYLNMNRHILLNHGNSKLVL